VLGRFTAENMARAGAKVVVSIRKAEACAEVVDAIREAGGEAIAVACNISYKEQLQDLVDRAIDEWGRIDVYFRKPPVTFFEHHEGGRGLHGNVLSIVLQPNEGFQLSLDVKRPGEGMKLVHTTLDFEYEDAFGELDDAYETLLSDVIEGNQTLFVHSDEVKESWRIWDGVLDCVEAPLLYEAGSDGPVV
jgi:hypothetical protein